MVDHSERNLISMFNLERETEAEEEKKRRRRRRKSWEVVAHTQ